MPKKRDLKAELSQLKEIQGEIQLLDNQLCELREKQRDISNNVKVDCVKASMPVFPYVLHSTVVQGLSDNDLGQKAAIKQDIDITRRLLVRKRKELVKEYHRLMSFIYSVSDSRMRQILTLRYVSGYEWPEIAVAMGGNNTEDGVRKAHNRFLEKY